MNARVAFYQEGNEVQSQQPTCEGFIKFQHRFSVNQIIMEDDMEKLITPEKFLNRILTEEWEIFSHEQENMYDKGYYIDMPYTIIDTYERN